MKEGIKPAAPKRDSIQRKIQRLIAEYHQREEQIPQLFRSLCRLAWEHRLEPEDFEHRLRQAGLASSRANELKQVYDCPTECAKFLAPEQPQAWEPTLAAARWAKWRRDFPPHAGVVDLGLAAIAGWLHRHGITEWEYHGYRFTLKPRSLPFEALKEECRA